MNPIERRIKSKIFYFKGTRHDCVEFFNSLNKVEKDIHGKKYGLLKLKSVTKKYYMIPYMRKLF